MHPISGREISSSSDDFKNFDEFVLGEADGGKANPGKYKGDIHDKFLGAFWTSQIGQISTEIPFGKIEVGDFCNRGIHVSVAVPMRNLYLMDLMPPSHAVVSGSGTYTGGGLQSEIPEISTTFGIIAGPSEETTLNRFDFFFLPFGLHLRQDMWINTVVLTLIPTNITESTLYMI